MVVGVARCELHLPGARSLKEKRKVVKSVVERLHHRFRISIAETAFHDLHQRAEIAIAAVGQGEPEVEALFEELRRLLDGEPEAYVTFWNPAFLDVEMDLA